MRQVLVFGGGLLLLFVILLLVRIWQARRAADDQAALMIAAVELEAAKGTAEYEAKQAEYLKLYNRFGPRVERFLRSVGSGEEKDKIEP